MSQVAYSDIDDLIGPPLDDAPAGPPVFINSVDGDDGREIGVSLNLSDVHAGVSVYWLAQIFGMGTGTVKKKLAECPPMRKMRNATLYNLRQAAAYLVDPKVDLERYIKTLSAADLPPSLNKDYWEALLKRQKYEIAAGDAWRTEDVLEVFGDVFTHIKSSTQLWQSTIDRVHGLTNEQQATLSVLVDRLLDDLHARLVSMPKDKRTVSLRDHRGEEADPSA